MSKKTTARKLLKISGSVLYYIMLALLLAFMISFFYSRINNRPAFIFGRATLIITTGSMEPEIPARSCILIEKVDPAELEVGDVISFYSDDPAIKDMLNTHRISEIRREVGEYEFVTKGDNNSLADKHTARGERVAGRYVRSLPLLTLLATLFMGKYGVYFIILILLFCALLLILPELIKKRRAAAAARKAELESRVAAEVEKLRQKAGQKQDPDKPQ